MRNSVQSNFVAFTIRFEGAVPWMYLDVKGLVTVAIGNLIDPLPTALVIPFERADGTLASHDDIALDWYAVKSRQDLAKQGHLSFRDIAKLRMKPAEMQFFALARARQMETTLKTRFQDFDTWPAGAQLGLLSMAWAMGPWFRFPKFEIACHALRFDIAADECRMSEAGNPGLIPRNKANHALFLNASQVIEQGLDPETLCLEGVVS